METMNLTTFNKDIEKKGTCLKVQVDHYFTLESWSSKLVFLSDQVKDFTSITYRRKQIAVVVPYNGNVRDSLQPYFTELQHLVRVLAPVISVFDEKGKKIAQLDEKRQAEVS
jgi:predicted HAD superfamily phosphohydrolase